MKFVIAYVGNPTLSYHTGFGDFTTNINEARIYVSFQEVMEDIVTYVSVWRERREYSGRHEIREVRRVVIQETGRKL